MTKKARVFNFSGYKIYPETNKIVFKYEIEFYNSQALSFSETIILPAKTKRLKEKYIHKFLEPLSLILGISYYKLYYPPKIKISFKLSKEQAQFWNAVYRKGLGEFLYKNKLDPRKLAKFPSVKTVSNPVHIDVDDSVLLGIGGGKDSLVTMKLLENFKTSLFLVETMRPDPISERIIEKSGKNSLKIKRMIDSKILEMKDVYNGHIPISAIFAFLGILSCALYEYKYVVVGNAYTSNFGNLKYKGEVINHQWSKSAEFENLFQEYTRKFITPDITYFSLLRQFYEIRVAKMFAQMCKEYFTLFASCNRNFKVFGKRQTNLWCGECPKCAFVFLVFSPFIDKSELIKIFGRDLLNDDSLLPLYIDLLGFGKMKPFDCVGTFEESQAALYLVSQKSKEDKIVKALVSQIKTPKVIVEKVFKTYPAPTLPAPFKLLGLEKVGILGYGREGKVTEKYLKKKYPNLKIQILDQALDKNYLEKQMDCDLLIKTPGIERGKVKIPYTTATNLFFSQNKNFTIGITGSKGKSTTTSLVYEILKKAGKKVRMLGNIGNPMLETLLTLSKKDEIFVIELSSYMLEDIEYSPNIAVLLNLFPEHLDYHGGIKNYYRAKNNIFKFQKSGDIALRPPFNVKIPIKKNEVHLIGDHNIQNIKAATEVARIFKISDQTIKKAVSEFKGLPHRLENIGTWMGINFIDDSISTIPDSAIEALNSLPKTNIVILGGMSRGVPYKKLVSKILGNKKLYVFCIDDTGKSIYKELIKHGNKNGKYFYFKNLESAVKKSYEILPKGSNVVLSPAAVSFNQFKNFEERGEVFKSLAKKYGTK